MKKALKSAVDSYIPSENQMMRSRSRIMRQRLHHWKEQRQTGQDDTLYETTNLRKSSQVTLSGFHKIWSEWCRPAGSAGVWEFSFKADFSSFFIVEIPQNVPCVFRPFFCVFSTISGSALFLNSHSPDDEMWPKWTHAKSQLEHQNLNIWFAGLKFHRGRLWLCGADRAVPFWDFASVSDCPQILIHFMVFWGPSRWLLKVVVLGWLWMLVKGISEIVGESRPLSAFFPKHADFFTEMHF